MSTLEVRAETLVPGKARGAPLKLDEPLSFWGGFDPKTGLVIDRMHPQRGALVAGHVLMMAAGRGSSSGSAALAEAIRLGTAPAAILLLERDAIVIVGAMVAVELYGATCPVALVGARNWLHLGEAKVLSVTADASGAAVKIES